MNTKIIFGIFILSAALTGCISPKVESKCSVVRELANPQGWQLGRGKFQAKQIGDTVTVTASGENPTPNYENVIAKNVLTVFPPQLVLHRKAPSAGQLQVITPFEVCAKFTAPEKITKVTIHDADGAHEVNVIH